MSRLPGIAFVLLAAACGVADGVGWMCDCDAPDCNCCHRREAAVEADAPPPGDPASPCQCEACCKPQAPWSRMRLTSLPDRVFAVTGADSTPLFRGQGEAEFATDLRSDSLASGLGWMQSPEGLEIFRI